MILLSSKAGFSDERFGSRLKPLAQKSGLATSEFDILSILSIPV